MSDLISRQMAIELIERMKPYHQEADDIAEMIANMPSAQPEIIMCKDCKHYRKEHGWNCIEYMVCAISPIHTVIRKPDDFCSRAKRKE